MAFIDDIPGIRDLQRKDGEILPRRSILRLLGAVTVVDNPVEGTTDITFEVPNTVSERTVTITLGNASYAPLGEWGTPEEYAVIDSNVLRLSPLQAVTIHGLADLDVVPRLMFVNVSTGFLITLKHEGGVAADYRFACPNQADYTLSAGSSVEVVRDTVSLRWRVVL